MRVLFTALPLTGHFNPLVPIARAVRDAGHAVAFACPAGFAPVVEAAGFPSSQRVSRSAGSPSASCSRA